MAWSAPRVAPRFWIRHDRTPFDVYPCRLHRGQHPCQEACARCIHHTGAGGPPTPHRRLRPPTPGPPPGHDTCPRPASDDRIPIDGYRCGFVQPVFCLPSRRWSVGLTPAPSRRGATQKTLCVRGSAQERGGAASECNAERSWSDRVKGAGNHGSAGLAVALYPNLAAEQRGPGSSVVEGGCASCVTRSAELAGSSSPSLRLYGERTALRER